jgi:hypothetical protein
MDSTRLQRRANLIAPVSLLLALRQDEADPPRQRR